MTGQQQEIITLQTAWTLYLPDAPRLSGRSARIWSHHANDTDLALRAIETTAQRNKREPLRNCEAYAWRVLQHNISAYFSAQDSASSRE